ncbi:MAG TPA: IscS subfamily cysteine desulfurase [Candidatus Sulfotelmatobacter sp.]|jgi:cysteine desulfurase|nr:IscS subfamily cysteine desulfurase [Candidatus Sulfotelmatobacter sp.]
MSTDVKIPQADTQAHSTNGKGVKLPIYMDNHATTAMDPRVLEEMLPYFMEKFGNAASRNHSFGWAAEEGVETARERIAKLVGATTKEIIFTSGATESDNLAIKGVAEMYREKGNHIITAVTEHKAVLDTCKRLEKYGYRVTYMPVQKDGLIDLDDLKRAMDDKTILVTIMYANNEIGVIQPVVEIGKLCHERGVIFHTDATQAIGKVPVDVVKQNIDLASISGHKMYGPKGVGALYVRRKNPRVQVSAIIDGGGHERGMRSGTLNVPSIVGLGKACAIAQEEMPQESCRLAGLRNRLRDRIMGKLDEVYINGSMDHRLPGNLNISFAYVEGESLLMGINDIAVSSGSACTSATLEPSYVLKALGTGDDLAHSSIRFGIGRFNTEAEVDYVADRVIETVERLRELSPLYEMAKEGINLKDVKWAGEAH